MRQIPQRHPLFDYTDSYLWVYEGVQLDTTKRVRLGNCRRKAKDLPAEYTMPAIAFMRAQNVGNDAPARLLLFCSPLLLLLPALCMEVLAGVLWAATVRRRTRLAPETEAIAAEVGVLLCCCY